LKTRLASIAAVANALLLLTLTISGLLFLWLSPWIWWAAAGRLAVDPPFRLVVFANFAIYWVWSQCVVIKDIRAIRSRRKVLPNPHWSAEVPSNRQLWAAELMEFVELKVSKRLHGRLQVFLSIVPGVAYQKARSSMGPGWRLSVGFSTLAVLSMDELKAMALLNGVPFFRPVTRAHLWFSTLLRNIEFCKSALPPHTGFFSFTFWSFELLIKILRRFPDELGSWSLNVAATEFPIATIRCAAEKIAKAGSVYGMYVKLYHSISERGMMPPYTEGISRFCRSLHIEIPDKPAFAAIEGLWIYERQLLQNCFGPDHVRHLRLVGWDDLKEEIGVPIWRETVVQIRPVLSGSKVADIPQLIIEWRAVLKRWLILNRKAPAVTPDRQREFLISMLSRVFAVVLLDAGWRVDSTLGEEFRLVKDSSSLKPLHLVREVGKGAVSAAQFDESVRLVGVADLPLGITEDRASVPQG